MRAVEEIPQGEDCRLCHRLGIDCQGISYPRQKCRDKEILLLDGQG